MAAHMSEVRSKIAKLLKYYRNEAGLTVREAGQKLGKSNQTISAWEQGRGQPDAEMFLKLCEVYHVPSVSAFFGEDPTIQTNTDKLNDGSNFLSKSERQLIADYRSLNSEGKEYIMQTMAMAVQIYSGKNNAAPDVETAI